MLISAGEKPAISIFNASGGDHCGPGCAAGRGTTHRELDQRRSYLQGAVAVKLDRQPRAVVGQRDAECVVNFEMAVDALM